MSPIFIFVSEKRQVEVMSSQNLDDFAREAALKPGCKTKETHLRRGLALKNGRKALKEVINERRPSFFIEGGNKIVSQLETV